MATRSTKKQSESDSIIGAKNLIIVESPAKARTIKNFLGSKYEVVASKGHIRDLPKKKFGIEIKDKRFIPTYDISKEHADTVKKIQELHEKADKTYIATDEDREGEAIGYHIIEALDGRIEDFPRIVFHEITKNAIAHSLKNPRLIDMNRVNAQQARRLLDRIVGFKLSGLISKKIRNGLSAGRVQSSALKILVDRERGIRAFEPQDYFLIEAKRLEDSAGQAIAGSNSSDEEPLVFDLVKFEDKKIEKLSLQDSNEAATIVESLRIENSTKGFIVSAVTKKERKTKSPPPFMTSTLQQASSSALGFSPTRTMVLAQKLYEGVKTAEGLVGVITYMRTDSLNIAEEAIASARDFIATNFGRAYLPKTKKIYVAKQRGAQEAHEAIRPTNLAFTPAVASGYLESDELKLYTLIFNRFVASQMEDALFEGLSVTVSGTACEFKITGRKLLFDGFYRVLGGVDKDRLLPDFREGEILKFGEINDVKKTTEPPARYSEASLIKTLEGLGIGRPSTYAPTIKLLSDRNYVSLENKQLVVQDISFTVIDLLDSHFNEIVDSGFSAGLEGKLDDIAEHKLDWQGVLWDFYAPFMEKIEKGISNIESQKSSKPTGEFCPDCQGELVVKNGRYGEFVACSNYPSCRYVKKDISEEGIDEVCEKCGSPMVVKVGRNGKFMACSAYPKCKNAKPLTKPESIEVPCPKCGGKLMARSSKRGSFYGCSNYPSCRFIVNNKPTLEKCNKCGGMLCLHKTKENTLVCIDCKEAVIQA